MYFQFLYKDEDFLKDIYKDDEWVYSWKNTQDETENKKQLGDFKKINLLMIMRIKELQKERDD